MHTSRTWSAGKKIRKMCCSRINCIGYHLLHLKNLHDHRLTLKFRRLLERPRILHTTRNWSENFDDMSNQCTTSRKRLVAYLIDTVVKFLLALRKAFLLPKSILEWLPFALLILCGTLMEYKCEVTIGKAIVKTTVFRMNGQRPDIPTSFCRNFGKKVWDFDSAAFHQTTDTTLPNRNPKRAGKVLRCWP